VLPDASDLPPLVGGTHRPGSPMPVVSVNRGLRPGAPGGGTYPPLAVPAEPPREPADPSLDRAFEKRLWTVTMALLGLALVVTGMTFRPGPAWAEMPTDQVLLSVDGGQAKALIDGKLVSLDAGASRYLRTHDQIEVTRDAGARLTFKGGAVARLCSGSRVEIGVLSTGAGRHQTPSGTLKLVSGRLVADTASASGAYAPLNLTVSRARDAVISEGAASFVVDPETATSARGRVTAGSEPVPDAASVSCGNAVPAPPLSPLQESTEAPFPADSGAPSAEVTDGPSLSASPNATVEAPSVTLQPIAPPPSRASSTPTRTATSRPPSTRPTTPNQPKPTQTQSTPPPTPTEDPTTTAPTPDPSTTTEGVRAPSN
jgi:putative peptide zinc metalloprotease protein